jgi:hypothetical protein
VGKRSRSPIHFPQISCVTHIKFLKTVRTEAPGACFQLMLIVIKTYVERSLCVFFYDVGVDRAWSGSHMGMGVAGGASGRAATSARIHGCCSAVTTRTARHPRIGCCFSRCLFYAEVKHARTCA